MSHFSDEITEILTRHGMEHEPLPDDWEEEDFDLLSVFCLLGDQYLLFSVDVTEPGGCGESLEEFCCSCLLYTSPSPRDRQKYRMPSSA